MRRSARPRWECVENGHDGRGPQELAALNPLVGLVQRHPVDGFPFVDVRIAHEVGPASQVQILRGVRRTDHGLRWGFHALPEGRHQSGLEP